MSSFPTLAEDLGHVDAVHDRSEHSDLVCLGTVDRLAGTSSPEVSSADHDTDFHTAVHNLLYLFCDFRNGRFVKSRLFFSGKRFAAQF